MAKNPDERTKELHELLKNERTKRHTTIAVGNTNENTSVVGTSDEYMRTEIKKALTEDEIPAKSKKGNHAEENVIEEAEKRNFFYRNWGKSSDLY